MQATTFASWWVSLLVGTFTVSVGTNTVSLSGMPPKNTYLIFNILRMPHQEWRESRDFAWELLHLSPFLRRRPFFVPCIEEEISACPLCSQQSLSCNLSTSFFCLSYKKALPFNYDPLLPPMMHPLPSPLSPGRNFDGWPKNAHVRIG